MKTSLSYGMVGGSLNAFIGGVHREAIAFDRRAGLAAGCFSRDAEQNAAAGAYLELDDARVYADFHTMAEQEAARPDGIDFAVIVTPNYKHYEAAKAFLQNGINVVCEKPLCFEIGEAEELKRLAAEKNLLFGVTYAYSGYSLMKFARQLIGEGKIGEIINVNAEYLQEWLIDELGHGEDSNTRLLSGWRTDPAYAGISNCTGDIGTHIEHTVAYLTGLKIKQLSAKVHKFEHALDLHANILVEYENGASGVYACSQVCAGYQNALAVRIFGTQGAIEWQQENPDILKVTYKGQPPQFFARGTGSITGRAATLKRIPSGHPEGYHIAFANLYKTYIGALLKKANNQPLTPEDLDFPNAEDGLDGVKFLHAVIGSGENGSRWEEVGG
ncbi:MAG: Gfo/Idh/MocA family oxidoreductase [Oscillospiraceae bacterium]|nr:Gfo/Idh/MocA family oxidoreductase [Oscillospiraceae bacterium]